MRVCQKYIQDMISIISQIQIQIPTYEKKNLQKHLENIKAIKTGSRNL